MKPFFLKLTGALALAGVIASCSNGGGGFAGIGGSGFISTGTVTGFGSVFVNGVEFQTTSATSFEVEDNVNAIQSDLRIGMVVQVKGEINSDGINGTATYIRYGDDIEGPVNSLTTNQDGTKHTFNVLGVTVIASKTSTVFENITFATLADGNVVEISGFYDNNDQLQATYIERKLSSTGIYEVKGTISGFTDSNSNFSVNGVTVNAANATLSDLPNNLQNNEFVEVKGTFAGGVLNANYIEGTDNSLNDDGSNVSIEGYVGNYSSISSFKINGYTVNASGATFEPASLMTTLGDGAKVEAEGPFSNGVLMANKVEIRGGNAELSANVSSVNQANSSFDVEFFTINATYNITVKTTTATQMEDDIGIDGTLTLSELELGGGYVEVRGYESGPTEITATRVKRTTAEDFELQGVVTAQIQDASITVLGVVFPVDNISVDPTQFEDENEVQLADHAEFISRTVTDQSVISIKDKASGGNDLGVADEVEIEIP